MGVPRPLATPMLLLNSFRWNMKTSVRTLTNTMSGDATIDGIFVILALVVLNPVSSHGSFLSACD